MIQRIALMVLVVLAVVGFERLPILQFDKVPHSKPTPIEIFMSKISDIESGGNHRVVNQYGMMGKYQFSPSTVRGLGFRLSKQEFLNNPEIQDTVMLAYMKANQEELQHLIDRYEGKTIKGVKITRASILAGAHFAGSGGVRAFLTNTSYTGTVDGNGTTLRYYMSKFKDIQLPALNTG